MVGLTGKCRRGSALDKPDFFFGLPKAVLSPDREGGWKIWKPGCPRKTGPARADSSSLQPTSWPRQVTSKKSTGSLFYCFTPRNLECHRWLCFDRNLLYTQIYKISESKSLKTASTSLFLAQGLCFLFGVLGTSLQELHFLVPKLGKGKKVSRVLKWAASHSRPSFGIQT